MKGEIGAGANRGTNSGFRFAPAPLRAGDCRCVLASTELDVSQLASPSIQSWSSGNYLQQVRRQDISLVHIGSLGPLEGNMPKREPAKG